MVESSKRVAPWREAVKAAAEGAGPCLDGPLAVAMIFTLPRPKTAKKAYTVPDKYPDLSKLVRATEDAITDIGLWADDARIASYAALMKVFSGYHIWSLPNPGVVVAAVEMTGDDFAYSTVVELVEHQVARGRLNRGAAA
jgi:Holliday junction resolvase RusA-like endonuclease